MPDDRCSTFCVACITDESHDPAPAKPVSPNCPCGACGPETSAAVPTGPGLRDRVTEPELTLEEARDLVTELGTDLYRAQDALAFVEECCVIADRESRPITTADIREWLKGARCGRQLLADRSSASAPADQAAVTSLRRMADETQQTEAPWPTHTDYALEIHEAGTWTGVTFRRNTLDAARERRESYRSRFPDSRFRIVRWDDTATVVEEDPEPAT